MKQIQRNIFLALLLLIAVPAMAQESKLEQVEMSDLKVSEAGGTVTLEMKLQISDLELGSNELLLITPILRPKSATEISRVLPQIQLLGRNRDIQLMRRHETTVPDNLGSDIYMSQRYRKDEPLTIEYRQTFPFEEWLRDSELLLAEQSYGCADCFRFESTKVLATNIGEAFFVPTYRVNYLVPEVEPVKSRADTHTATLNFRTAKHDLDPNYGNNRAVLGDVQKVMNEVVKDELITITHLTVAGFASPEASTQYNQALSERRAATFADWLAGRYGFKKSQMHVTAPGEDWTMTRQLVADSQHADRDAILSIIDNTLDQDARDPQLKQLSGGATYRWMLETLYPHVRRVEYTIAYEVRPFSVEEAREIIKRNPKLLSLNEMYLVAHSYEPLSKEFKEVFDIAVRLFPNEPVAIINASAADIEGGNAQAAIERLEKLGNNPDAWNNLGVAYWKQGNLEKAHQYLHWASEKGSETAKQNLSDLLRVMNK